MVKSFEEFAGIVIVRTYADRGSIEECHSIEELVDYRDTLLKNAWLLAQVNDITKDLSKEQVKELIKRL